MNQTQLNPRSQAREIALQTLFQAEFTARVPAQDFLGLFEESVSEGVLEYARTLVDGVAHNADAIDALIQSVSQKWKVERMALVDRNVLRVAVFEMGFLHEKTKASIVINEAVEMAKKFSSTESSAFVNGLLDQLRREKKWD